MKSRPQVLTLLLLATIANFGNGQPELHVAFITSFEGEFDSSVTVPAVQLARDAVNRDSTILPGYKLVVELIENLTVARNFTNSEVNFINPARTGRDRPRHLCLLDTRFCTGCWFLQY